MLFKVIDDKGKLIEYRSVCVSPTDLGNGNLDSIILNGLKSRSTIYDRLVNSNFNRYLCNVAVIKVEAYMSGIYKPWLITEILSNKRKQQIQNYIIRDNSTTTNIFITGDLNTESTSTYVYTANDTRSTGGNGRFVISNNTIIDGYGVRAFRRNYGSIR